MTTRQQKLRAESRTHIKNVLTGIAMGLAMSLALFSGYIFL